MIRNLYFSMVLSNNQIFISLRGWRFICCSYGELCKAVVSKLEVKHKIFEGPLIGIHDHVEAVRKLLGTGLLMYDSLRFMELEVSARPLSPRLLSTNSVTVVEASIAAAFLITCVKQEQTITASCVCRGSS